jgi:hypothetical protein
MQKCSLYLLGTYSGSEEAKKPQTKQEVSSFIEIQQLSEYGIAEKNIPIQFIAGSYLHGLVLPVQVLGGGR